MLDVKQKFFTQRVMRHWNMLPGEVLEAQFLAVLGVNMALRDMA